MRYGLFLLLWIAWPALSAEAVRVPIDDYPPWKIVAGDTATGGIDLELTSALLAKIGLSAKYIVCPWKRCLHSLEKGEADLVSGITRTPERETYLSFFSIPYKNLSKKVFYVRKGERQKYRNLKDFEGKTVALLRGAKQFSAFDDNVLINKFETSQDENAFMMLSRGRIDALVITQENGRYLLARHTDLQDKVELADFAYEGKVAVFFAISRHSPLLTRQTELEAALKKMLASGEVRQILGKIPQ